MTAGDSINKWLEEAIELRHGSAEDPKGPIRGAPEETIHEVLDLLGRVKQRADRIDELATKTAMARSRIKLAADEAKFTAETQMYTATRDRASRKSEFTSGRELEADAKLDSFEARHAAHQVAQLVEQANTAYEILNQISWQLGGIRSDLRARLHALQFESSL